MNPLTDRLLGRMIALRGGEGAVALLMFAYSFLAMTSYNILKPLTKSKFIADLGADNLPWVLLAAGALIGLLMDAYSRAIRRVPRRHVIPLTQAVIVALLVIFWTLLRTGAVWVTAALYLFGLMLGVLLISQFWTLANDVYDARQAKRLFGFIGGGASLGGVMGGALIVTLIKRVGPDNLLLVSAAALAACAGIVMLILRRQHTAGAGELAIDEKGVGGREALRLLGESRHLKVMALIIGIAVAGATVVDQQLSMAVEVMKGPGGEAGIAAFLAQVGVYSSAAGFLVQVGLTSRIHRSLGLAFALLLLPVTLGTSAAVILMTGALSATAAARVLDLTLRYTVDKTTREILFLPLPADLKYRAKPFIDVTAEKFAKAVVAILLLFLIKGFGFDYRRLSYASLVMTGLWIVMALVARREYLATFRASIGAQTIAPDAIRAGVADAATVETLVEELSNPDESAVLYAIQMLEAFDKRNLITPLLLQHPSPRVRARTLLALASAQSRFAAQWTPAIERMVQDEDVDVRAAALRALATLSHEDAPALLRRHLDDPEPRVAVAAATALANSGDAPDVAAAEAALLRLVADNRQAAAPGRREAAAALAHVVDPRFRLLLVRLLDDHDPSVVEQAIRSARAMGASDGVFLPGLIALLGHRALKSAARETLVDGGESIVAALGHALHDRREHAWVRRHIPATLALIPVQASMDALVATLQDPDGFLRFKAIAAMEHLRRNHPAITFPASLIETRVVQEASRYSNILTLQYNLRHHPRAGHDSLVGRALDDKLARTLDRIYRLLGLRYDVDDVAAARYTIEHGEPRRRAAAIEYLDNILEGAVRKRVLPILDDTPLPEKVRQANLALKTRPRDVEETLAQLLHEEDPVVAAAAIHFVAREQLWGLTGDLEYVIARRSRSEGFVIEAAEWAMHTRRHGGVTRPLPAVELADRARAVPLFQFVSVDELFRIAGMGQEVRHHAGRELHHIGAPADDVQILLEGAVRVGDAGDAGPTIGAPAVLGLEDVLQGAPRRATISAIEDTVCFRISSADFLTMISDNVLLAQGLFRMLLAPGGELRSSSHAAPPAGVAAPSHARQPVEQALLLRQHPLLARATATQLLTLIAMAREVRLAAGATLFDPGTPPAIYQVLQGEVVLESGDADPIVVRAGTTIGVAETLAGVASHWRATVSRDGRALHLDREALFTVLADHLDLMQGLFSGVLDLPQATAEGTAPSAMTS